MVQILREKNNLLSRRRRAKRAHIQQGENLILANVGDIQGHREANV